MGHSGFYYDIVCPYAYMAFSFLKREGVFNNKKLKLNPILLGGLFKHMEQEADPNKSLSSAKSRFIRLDIMRQAQYFSAPLKFHERHPVKTVSAMRLLHACPDEKRESLTERLYKAYWQENLNIDDDSVIEHIANEFDLKGPSFWYEAAKASLIKATREAFLQKIFGVPTIMLNNKLYFGGDRLCLIAQKLGISLPDHPWQPNNEPIDFYFDFSSPYSYLAWIEVKKARTQGVRFNLKPILLGALFKEVGMATIPLLNSHQHKIEYYFQDMQDWADFRGAPFVFNSYFPLRTVTPLRVALLEEKVVDVIFRAAWAENKNIGEPDILHACLSAHGFSATDLLNKAEDIAIKDKLKSNNAEALARGVFGVPSFFINNQLIFGQDRFPFIRMQLKHMNEQ